VIGITSYAREGDPLSFGLPCDYVDVVRVVGGTPLILPPGEQQPEHLLELLDGLIVSGGGDIGAAAYGGQPHETAYNVSKERDAFEFTIAKAALERSALPLLCICRGIQVLNVVCGGTLHPHVPERFGEKVRHRLPPRVPTRHPVRIDPANRLSEILGTDLVDVCSWHHQAIDRIGKGLQAVAWAEDGVIEAVEHETHPWCIGVQWHPEMQLAEEPHRRLFAALVAASQGNGEQEDGRTTQ
jgi:putative glutamine amidotransferase